MGGTECADQLRSMYFKRFFELDGWIGIPRQIAEHLYTQGVSIIGNNPWSQLANESGAREGISLGVAASCRACGDVAIEIFNHALPRADTVLRLHIGEIGKVCCSVIRKGLDARNAAWTCTACYLADRRYYASCCVRSTALLELKAPRRHLWHWTQGSESKRRVGKSAQRCVHVSINANCKSDVGTLRFAHSTLAGKNTA